MSKTTNTATVNNSMRTVETAKAVNAIIAKSQLSKLYTIAFNENVDKSNRIAIFNESIENAKQIVETMKLQSDFMQAVARCTVWLDETQIVVFVGAVYTVHTSVSAKKNVELAKQYAELYKSSLDSKYNERTLKKKKITALTETRHTFNSVADFETFFNLFSQLVALRSADNTAKETKAKTTKEVKSKAKKNA